KQLSRGGLHARHDLDRLVPRVGANRFEDEKELVSSGLRADPAPVEAGLDRPERTLQDGVDLAPRKEAVRVAGLEAREEDHEGLDGRRGILRVPAKRQSGAVGTAVRGAVQLDA